MIFPTGSIESPFRRCRNSPVADTPKYPAKKVLKLMYLTSDDTFSFG
jgi:hypothetical protein